MFFSAVADRMSRDRKLQRVSCLQDIFEYRFNNVEDVNIAF